MLLDDAELVFQALAIVRLGDAGREAVGGETAREARPASRSIAASAASASARLPVLSGKARQDRLARAWPPIGAHGDFDCVFNRFRQVGEQFDHLGAGLEIVFLASGGGASRRQRPCLRKWRSTRRGPHNRRATGRTARWSRPAPDGVRGRGRSAPARRRSRAGRRGAVARCTADRQRPRASASSRLETTSGRPAKIAR